MAEINYGSAAEDHQSFLVLVKHIGTKLNSRSFTHIWERIRRLRQIKINDQNRTIWVRYRRAYAAASNEMGDFQAHRKVLGLIAVGHCSNHDEFSELFESYKNVKEVYANTIFNSRLIAFGLNPDGSQIVEKNCDVRVDSGVQDRDGTKRLSVSHEEQSTSGNSTVDGPSLSKDSSNISTDSNSSVLGKENVEIEHPLSEPKSVKLPERESSDSNCTIVISNSGKDTVTNSSKKQQVTRSHSGSLSKNNAGAEVVFYPDVENCQDMEERLREFIVSLFYVLESKRLDRSFERPDKLQLLCAPFEKKDFVGIDTDSRSYKKRCQGRLRKHLADLSLQAVIPGDAILHYQTAIDLLKAVHDWLWIGACYEGLCAASVVLSCPHTPALIRRNQSFTSDRGAALNDPKIKAGHMTYANGGVNETKTQPSINVNDIIEKYREAISCYSRLKNAGVIELETSLKACRVLIGQHRYLEASDFLQNVVYINLQMSEEDKIQKYSTLSSLYTQIGFHRKSAFFKRITAMQCVAPQYTRPNWHQCYMLLLQILEPYLISLDSREFPTVPTTGWPVIQLRVLNELVFSAKKMGNPQLAVRHMSFLLQTVFDYLTDVEKQEAASALETLTARCEGTPQPLALDTGLILPPVPLLKLPVVHLFKPLPMQPHLQPVLLPKKRALTPELIKNSPFIYSPFVHAGLKKTDKSRQDYKWVHGDICEVNIQMSNPMPEELRIMHMALLTAGMEIDIFPSSPSLPAHSAPSLVKLVAIPRGVGDLQLIGYSTHVLGVRSHCKLKDMRQIHETRLTVEIVPSLPLIQVSTSFAKSASFFPELDGANIVTSATAVIYAGQSLECLITINNVGNEVVDWLDISLESKLHKGLSNSVLCWNTENVQSQLPLQQHGVACFMVCINGISDFLSTVDHDLTFETEPQTAMPSVVSMWGPRRPRASTINSADDSPTDVVSLESLLFIHYSGGSGLKAGYCRDSAIGFSIEILPSLSFWKWHVLPDRNCSKCHLVFDVRNDSGHQLDLQYSSSHSLILEPGQIRRFSVQIDRLTLPDECRCKKKLRNNVCASPNSEHSTTNSISQILAASVDIRWSIPSVKAKGKSSIEYLEWSEAHLKLIQKSPVNCDYCINGDVYDSATPFLVSYCDIVDLSVQLEFSSDTDEVPDGVYLLSVRAYQDSCDGDRDYDMADKVSVLAASSLVIHKEKTSSLTSHSLSCTFMFYVCGLYKLDITLRSSDNSQSESRDAEHLQQLITGHSIWRCDIPPVIRVSSPEGDPGWTSQTVKNDVESDDDDNNNIDDPGWTSQTVKDDVESDDDDNNNIDDG